jgi:hypothetical protein
MRQARRPEDGWTIDEVLYAALELIVGSIAWIAVLLALALVLWIGAS